MKNSFAKVLRTRLVDEDFSSSLNRTSSRKEEPVGLEALFAQRLCIIRGPYVPDDGLGFTREWCIRVLERYIFAGAPSTTRKPRSGIVMLFTDDKQRNEMEERRRRITLDGASRAVRAFRVDVEMV